jgi:hypothetical protein
MAETCPNCGAAAVSGQRFCGACGTMVGACAAAPSVGTPDLAQPRNFARVAQVVALLGFVLPWVTISCQGHVLAQVSGLDMAIGHVSVRNPFTDVTQLHNGSPSLAIVIALVLVIGGLALSFYLTGPKAALVNAAASAAAALLAAYEVLVSARSAVRSQAASQPTSGLEHSLAEAIRVQTGFGFWLTCLALAAAAFFYWRTSTGGGRAVPGSAAYPPPTPEPRINAAGERRGED